MSKHIFQKIGLIFLVLSGLMFIILSFDRFDSNIKEGRHETYEAYKRVYKVELEYKDWEILYMRNMLPKTIENK